MAPIVNKRRAHSPVLTSAGGVRAIRNRLVLAAVAATAILWLYGALPVAEQVNKVNPTEALTIREITAVPLGDGSERNGGVLLRRHADKERWGPEDSQFREEFHRASVAKEAPVFVLGAMKAGSSALCEFLARHPQIAGGRHYGEEPKHYQKEIHYFDSDERWGKGISFYWDHWGADAAEEKLVRTPACMARIAASQTQGGDLRVSDERGGITGFGGGVGWGGGWRVKGNRQCVGPLNVLGRTLFHLVAGRNPDIPAQPNGTGKDTQNLSKSKDEIYRGCARSGGSHPVTLAAHSLALCKVRPQACHGLVLCAAKRALTHYICASTPQPIGTAPRTSAIGLFGWPSVPSASM